MFEQFLDTTIGESCRLTDYKIERHVFENADVQVHPGVALGGAAGLFATDLLAIRYTDWLQRFPLLFNVGQVRQRKGGLGWDGIGGGESCSSDRSQNSGLMACCRCTPEAGVSVTV